MTANSKWFVPVNEDGWPSNGGPRSHGKGYPLIKLALRASFPMTNRGTHGQQLGTDDSGAGAWATAFWSSVRLHSQPACQAVGLQAIEQGMHKQTYSRTSLYRCVIHHGMIFKSSRH